MEGIRIHIETHKSLVNRGITSIEESVGVPIHTYVGGGNEGSSPQGGASIGPASSGSLAIFILDNIF